MRRQVLLVSVALLAVGCQRGDGGETRHVSAEDGVSFAELSGWTARRDRGTLVLASPRAKGPGITIAIRTADNSGWSEPRTAETVLPAVEAVLAGLPGADVKGPFEMEDLAYRAVGYDIVFTPRSKRGKNYQRRHVVAFLPSRVAHVFLTAPEGRISEYQEEFDRVLRTIREEG